MYTLYYNNKKFNTKIFFPTFLWEKYFKFQGNFSCNIFKKYVERTLEK